MWFACAAGGVPPAAHEAGGPEERIHVLHRVCIVGLGLMGGAVGMATRKSGAATRVLGVGDCPETIEKARALGAVDESTLDLREGVRDADLVVLAVPLRMIPDVARSVLPHCRQGTIITDLGSSKAAVVAAVDDLIARTKAPVYFVGSHPIAGSEKTGIEAAGEVRLEGASCVLTPTPATDHEAYRKVDEFWKALGLKTMRLPPDEHDAVLVRSSHLPHLLSFALVGAQTSRSLQLSGPGLRDMTRLAGSAPELWTEIFAQNGVELTKVLSEFGRELLRLAGEIEALSQTGTPAAEAARERVFRYLADARTRHDERYKQAPKEEEDGDGEVKAEA